MTPKNLALADDLSCVKEVHAALWRLIDLPDAGGAHLGCGEATWALNADACAVLKRLIVEDGCSPDRLRTLLREIPPAQVDDAVAGLAWKSLVWLLD